MNRLIKQAFTLIELLVVIAIIGILSGLIVVSMGGMTQKATIAKSQVFSNSLRNSLMLNLVSEWKLDANADDSWKGSNSGSVVGAVVNTTDCVSGSCYNFDGNGDYISINSNTSQNITDAITMSTWVKISSSQPNDYPFIFGKHWRYFMWIPKNSSTPRMQLMSGGAFNVDIGASSAIALNQWNFIVGTYDKNGGINNAKIYVNGVLSNKATATGVIDTVNANMWFGVADISWVTAGFIGSIDETRLYDAAIPISKVREQYYAGLNNILASGSISKLEYINKINETAQK